MTVIWTKNSLENLDILYQFLLPYSPLMATDVIDRITSRGEQLGQFPESGRVVPEYGRREIREIFEGSYRIIYRTDTMSVSVLTVIHGKVDLTGKAFE